MLKINSNLLTDVGLVRKANEDFFGEVDTSNTTKNGHIFIVCDGMGGHVGGAVASQMAVDCIVDFFNTDFYDNIYLAIEKSISFANTQIFLRSQSDASLKGMGTTCTVLVQRDDELFIGHVGDSRIYIQTDGKLFRLTKDHSYVQTLVDKGEITDSEMELHPRKNELTQALGVAESVNVEVSNTPILAKIGDKILMCSDGLCGFVSDKVISQVLQSDSVNKSNNALISLANNAGGGDNITVGLIEIIESPHHKTVFVNKNNRSNSLTSTQEVDIKTHNNRFSFHKMKSVIIGFPLLILVVLFFSFYDFGGNSVPPKTGDESKQENTSNPGENPIVEEEQSDFKWKVDSILKFGDASAQFQKEFKKQKGCEGKSSDDLQSHIQNNSIFSFEKKEYTYQVAKEKFNKTDKTLKGGVFTVSCFDANDSVQKVKDPINREEDSPKRPNLDKECRELQKTLKNKGYYNGNIYGDCGKGTKQAELDFKVDKDLVKEIKELKEKGWSIKKPNFGIIDPVKFNGVIDDKIKGILSKKLNKKSFNFKSALRTEEVVLYFSKIKVEDVNKEIKSLNKQINENKKIDSVSFSKIEVSPSYPLKVNGVTIGYYNYREKEDPEEEPDNSND